MFSASTWGANIIENVSFEALPGDRVQLAIQTSGPAIEPLSFTINNPARIALDFQNTTSSLKQKNIPVGIGPTSSVNVATHKNRTRVVINLAEMLPYQIQKSGNILYVTLSNVGDRAAATTSVQSINTGTSSPAGQNSIENIDFRRGESGEGMIIATLGSSSVPVNVLQEGNRVIAEFVGAQITDDMLQRLDVLDFATPAKYIDIAKTEDSVRLIMTPVDANFEHLAYQSDNTFTLEVKPISKEDLERAAREKFGYTGERLSLNFQDIEVRSVLQLIADFTGLNVVVSDSVQGKLTLRLKNVPWDQALDIILKTKGLDKRKSGNVLLIAPTEEIAQQEKLSLEAKQQVTELAPLQSEFFQVNFAKATTIAELLTGGESGGGNNTIISERGSVSVDERTNTLMVHETAATLEKVRQVVTKLDIPVKQVLIESRIVIATDEFDKQLGARFGITKDGFGTSTTGTNSVTSGGLFNNQDLLGNEPLSTLSTDRLNFNLPVNNTGAGSFALSLAKLPGDTLLELELSALQAEGEGEVISTPRVITANQKEAFIEQGVEIPYLEASSSGAATVTFKKAVLSLTVTPQITPDERIILDLIVKKDSVGEVFAGIPSIDTREVETQVLVQNGETIVLGGIFEHETSDTVVKVPFFGDLPLLGRFFRSTEKNDEKREILIFVTPKVIRDTLEFN